MAKTLFDKLFSRVDRPSEDPEVCWPWLGGTDNYGYGRISWKGKSYQTHRASFDEVVDDIPEGMLVCHTCDNPPCCRPSHLFLGTTQDNVDDKMVKGRHGFKRQFGSTNAAAILTEAQAREIFHLAWKGELTQREIGDQFGIRSETVSSIKSGVNWAHLDLRVWRTPQIVEIYV